VLFILNFTHKTNDEQKDNKFIEYFIYIVYFYFRLNYFTQAVNIHFHLTIYIDNFCVLLRPFRILL